MTMLAKTIGKNIRKLRKMHGWTQIELAQKMDCTQGMITGYENYRKVPTAERLVRLSELFNISIDELVCENIQAPNNETDALIERPRLWKKFCEVEKLPESEKKAIFKMINMALRTRSDK